MKFYDEHKTRWADVIFVALCVCIIGVLVYGATVWFREAITKF